MVRLVVFAVGTAMVAGCTFLVSFDDPLPPLAPDAQVPDASIPDTAPPPDARASFDPSKSTACTGLGDGHYCGNNQLVGYPFADDLVECVAGKIKAAKVCTLHCLHLKNPHPDQCDECATKPDGGYFCGTEMTGWQTENAKVRVHCQSGIQDELNFDCVSCTPAANAKGVGTATCPK